MWLVIHVMSLDNFLTTIILIALAPVLPIFMQVEVHAYNVTITAKIV